MKKSKGFILLTELSIFCLACFLLLAAVHTVVQALSYQRQALVLSEAMQAAQQVLAGEAAGEQFSVRQISSEEQNMLEVQVVYEQTAVNLWQAQAR